ncbi:MAG: hypothetical protein EA389_12780 [Ilumatobacter sp.]|nr:MAG: hypothetical protein EA389_12780 [Ilumatobacter sp.]
MGTRGNRRIIAAGTAAALLFVACSSGGDDGPAPVTTPGTAPGASERPEVVTVPGRSDDDPMAASVALGVRLSDGSPTAGAPSQTIDLIDLVAGVPLPSDEVGAILDRLPDWVVPETDRRDFNRPPDSLRPPLVGDTIDAPFPPSTDPGAPTEPAAGPLEVLRAQPDGEVAVAPFLSITFDQPMVPLATLDQLADEDVPVVVTPAVEGRWRWIGTRTLRFEVEPGGSSPVGTAPEGVDRLPAATEYRVEVPAGTRATSGAELATAFTWTFATPAPTVRSFHGESSSLALTPVFVAVFDQLIDPAAVLDTITLRAGGQQRSLRLATEAEIDADDQAARMVASALDGRWVAFRPTDPLPGDARIDIDIGPGSPSAEGPRVSDRAETYSGRTFGPLEVDRHSCGNDRCVPLAPFVIEFSNPIDPDTFDADRVRVEPAVPGLRAELRGSELQLRGSTAGRTRYTVALDGAIGDVFGQTLGDDVELTFDVGEARPLLGGPDQQIVTTDPAADAPSVSVVTVNHDQVRVTAWAVTPADLRDYVDYKDAFWSDARPADPSWRVVFDDDIDVDGVDDTAIETSIDLSRAFADSGGPIVVRIEPTREISPRRDDWWSNRPIVTWVQDTGIGVDAIVARDELLIWTTELLTGNALPGVAIELLGDGRTVTTDTDGLARVELTSSGVNGLVASLDGDQALLSAGGYDGWRRRDGGDESRWYVFDDRGVYRPGETVRLTGWVRRFAAATDAQLAIYEGATAVDFIVYDPQGNQIAGSSTELNALGGFNLSFEVPEESNLGEAWIEFSLSGPGTSSVTSYHTVQVQEFRTPEFEVTARHESAAPFFTAEPTTVAVDAEYFAGGGLPDAEVDWRVTTRTTDYTPPNWDDFSFGIWTPWWGGGWFGHDAVGHADISFDPCFDCPPGIDENVEFHSGRTDATGTHYLRIDFDAPEVDLPATVTAEATVFDVNRQAWASRTDLLVHPARYYVGLRSDRPFVEQGTPLRIDAAVTDVDGGVVDGRTIEMSAGRLEWLFSDGQWTEEVADTETCSVTSTVDPRTESARCEFSTDIGGRYEITAVVTDDAGYRNRSVLTQWVTGGEGRPSRQVEQQEVTVVPDRETYQPGDTAELLVQAPFAPATGLVTVMRGGIVSTSTFGADDGSAVIEVPIESSYVPNVTVQIDMVGSADRTADDGTPLPDVPDRPAYATTQIDLAVPPISRALAVTATPAEAAVEPGTDTSVTVEVRDADGNAVSGANVALVVVDEAVLALTGYELADPLDVFYRDVYSDVFTEYGRRSVLLERPDLLGAGQRDGDSPTDDSDAAADAPAAEGDFDEMAEPEAGRTVATGADAIDIRTDFDALAVYAPDESTDADGAVTVDVPLPDNLTRYRIMAVAVDGIDHFGKGESTITARLPLMVRPSAPRFLNFGDRFELPVVVQNQTDDTLEVDVVVQAANLTLDDGEGDNDEGSAVGAVGRRVTVPANDRVEVRFPADADEAGTARFRVAAVSGEVADAAGIELPVYTPATAEAFATYGVVDDGAIAQPLLAPEGVFPQFGGLEINTSSTALQALTDAVLYLAEYRFDSADALASRIMAVAALRDVLDAFDAEGLPAPDQLDAQVAADIERLAALQNDDGGFPYWQRGQRSIPWVSLQSAHALVLADEAGYTVPRTTLDRALGHLADIERYLTDEYGENLRDSLSAYALHVRHLAGDRDTAKAGELYRRAGDDLELDALAWLWPVLDDPGIDATIERVFTNRAVETAGAATFATGYGENAYLIAHSDRRTDGVVLDALITQRPDSDLIPKVVAGLLGNQRQGRWNNVHENAFILLAMKRYFDTFEAVTPDFVARAWLGDLYAAEHTYEGRTTDRATSIVPTDDLISTGDTTVVLDKDGTGRLYYRLGLRYAPDDLRLDARDEGFVVDRIYEALDDPGDVRRNDDGTWEIRAGATVRVRLTMVADARRTHVALIDPLPAGLEPLNPSLAVSPSPPPDADGDAAALEFGRPFVDDWCWCWHWFEHQNLRDDRAEAFTSYLSGGTYEYTYVARATTPGTFVVPPARAEEMYAPEVFGRSPSTTVVVMDRS